MPGATGTATMLDAALHYRQMWGAPVVPVNDHKQPLCEWGQWRYGGQTESALKELFSRPAHGLALLLWPASTLAVMDFDGPHAEQAWLSTGVSVPRTARVHTPHGAHDYFRMPPSVECDEVDRKVRIVTARECGCVKPCGVDLLVKGYALAPPTPRYREDPDYLLEPSMIASLPDGVLALMRHATATNNGERTTIAERIPEGKRNDTLFRLARSLKARDMSPDAILAALLKENELRCVPPLDDSEIERIVAHAFKQPDRGDFERNGTPGPEEHTQEGKSLKAAVVEYRGLLTLELPERKRYLPWMAERSNAMLYGPRGVGKTMANLGLATALVSGTEFLKWPVTEPVGVLYVDGEMQLDDLRARATAFLTSPPKARLSFLTAELVYHALQRDLVLTSATVRDEIVQILEQYPDIRVVIFDNISSLCTGIDEQSKRDWEPIAAWLTRLRHRGLATTLVHHGGKSGDQRGTSGREDSLDTVIRLDRPAGYDPREGCHFELRFTKSRGVKGDDVASLDIRLADDKGKFGWIVKPIEESHFDRVKQLIVEGVTSPTEIAEELGVTKGYASKLVRKVRAAEGTA